jgi:hypothetical protein
MVCLSGLQLCAYRDDRDEETALVIGRRAEGIYRLLSVIDVSDSRRLRERGEVVVVRSMSRLLEVVERCPYARDRCRLECFDERFDRPLELPDAPRNPSACDLQVVVAKRPRQIELLAGVAFWQQHDGALAANAVEECVVRCRDSTT